MGKNIKEELKNIKKEVMKDVIKYLDDNNIYYSKNKKSTEIIVNSVDLDKNELIASLDIESISRDLILSIKSTGNRTYIRLKRN